jgi:hypothetical protein
VTGQVAYGLSGKVMVAHRYRSGPPTPARDHHFNPAPDEVAVEPEVEPWAGPPPSVLKYMHMTVEHPAGPMAAA